MRVSSGEEVKVTFRNEDDDGTLQDTVALPTAVLYVDGEVDGSVTVTVTRLSTGTYQARWVMGSYEVNDIWELVVSAEYNGISFSRILKEGYIGEAAYTGSSSRFVRLEAYLYETPTITWQVGNNDLDSKTLRMQVGTGSYVESPALGSLIYTFTNAQITRDNSYATITIPAVITNNIGTYPWSLQDITTGTVELQTGVIDVLYNSDQLNL